MQSGSRPACVPDNQIMSEAGSGDLAEPCRRCKLLQEETQKGTESPSGPGVHGHGCCHTISGLATSQCACHACHAWVCVLCRGVMAPQCGVSCAHKPGFTLSGRARTNRHGASSSEVSLKPGFSNKQDPPMGKHPARRFPLLYRTFGPCGLLSWVRYLPPEVL